LWTPQPSTEPRHRACAQNVRIMTLRNCTFPEWHCKPT
jgi:hypothetical protein